MVLDQIPPMYEYLLWNNCNNACRFCWQKHQAIEEKFLSNEEKCNSVGALLDILPTLPYSDILIVGGEIFEYENHALYQQMYSLFDAFYKGIRDNKIRYLYVNTNLLYQALDIPAVLIGLLNSNNLLDRLKFTTSYDPHGRFASKEDEALFLKNLNILTYSYPNLNIVVNTILTKQLCESDFDMKAFCDKYRVTINFIPYITLHEDMRATKAQVLNVLQKADSLFPGYIQKYINSFDLPQTKFLYEYIDKKGYALCSSLLVECGHSVNFKRVFQNNKCYICQIKEYLN